MNKTVIFYHANCTDGVAAAWMMHFLLGNHADYVSYQYGDVIPAEHYGKHFILVDLSFPAVMIEELTLAGLALSVMVIDHHKTAIEELSHFKSVTTYREYLRCLEEGDTKMVYLDATHSGAVLTYKFVREMMGLPEKPFGILRMIEDYDLWKHEDETSKYLVKYLMAGRLTIDRFESAVHRSECGQFVCNGHALIVGKSLYDNDERTAKSISKYAQYVNVDGKDVILLNGPSHLRNEMAELLKDEADYVVIWQQRSDKIVYNLRSREFDVSAIAKRNGGGGHRNAASFVVPTPFNAGSDQHTRYLVSKPANFLSRLSKAYRILIGKEQP